MKLSKHMLVVLVLVVLAGTAVAVPPAYEGALGNPEEPALRVLKWPWLGLRKLLVSTQDGLSSGLRKHPPAAIAEGAQGATAGARTLAHHIARGLVYAPLPMKQPLRSPETYEQQVERALNALFPETEACAAEPEQATGQEAPATIEPDSEEVHEGPPLLTPRIEETEVQKAQRRYIPLHASYRDRHKRGTGNLFRLAR